MFTLLVSWLLVACVPGLLILATLGLGRLERMLTRDTVAPTAVAALPDQAEAVDVHTIAREGMPEALEYLHSRQAQRLTQSTPPSSPPRPGHVRGYEAEAQLATDLAGLAGTSLPTRLHRHSRANPEFGANRHVNRV
ncbi:hypothetical protein [Mycobacterium spongiae]|uniref:Uncharacterized protein n=1 Tax=Mycobacterium spongiae TaxID=886343 RepID=A0A975K336_9MYCO|nr:hypothetical protein [Mycobacterium spongiae]QUR69993.1 hypothetical protein F6B93_21075 [Mycobacterium spongiae]